MDVRFWYKSAYPIYFICLFLLLVVDITGHIGMGAQRWIKLGPLQIQPSELMKIAVVMALARYFHSATSEDMKNLRFLFIGLLFLIGPFILVATQPDLGTSGVIVMVGIAMFFIAGAPIWIFLLGGAAVAAAAPLGWMVMHDYQRQRVLTFLDPERDPLGAGYHITQSKIALGSGGWMGKGFLKGTQSHLNFLPEKQTDFIFTLWVEEWGFFGGVFVLCLVALILSYGGWIATLLPTFFRASDGVRPDDQLFNLYLCQYSDGYGVDPRRWGSVSNAFLWWHGHDDGHHRVRPDDACNVYKDG